MPSGGAGQSQCTSVASNSSRKSTSILLAIELRDRSGHQHFQPLLRLFSGMRARRSSSQLAHVTERFTNSRNAFTWAGVHSSQRITGIPMVSR
jgi:hypothetical protein